MACAAPPHSDYLRVPVDCVDGSSHALATVRLPLAELRQRLPGFRPEQAAYYGQGRQPLAHREVDGDGDGIADFVVVKMPVHPGAQIILVHPGVPCTAALPDHGTEPAIVLHFDASDR